MAQETVSGTVRNTSRSPSNWPNCVSFGALCRSCADSSLFEVSHFVTPSARAAFPEIELTVMKISGDWERSSLTGIQHAANGRNVAALLVTPVARSGPLERLDRTAIRPRSLSEPGQGCRTALRSQRNDVLPNCKLDQFGVRS